MFLKYFELTTFLRFHIIAEMMFGIILTLLVLEEENRLRYKSWKKIIN